MGIQTWMSESVDRIDKEGLAGISESFYEFRLGVLRRLHNIQQFTGWNTGTPIFDQDWDVLIVLDACRYDLMKEVADEYDFINTVKPTRSVASTSHLWMKRNFSQKYASEMSQTAYVTGNSWSDRMVESDLFGHLDEVWRYATQNNLIPARAMTDRAISVWRNHSPEQMIIHYMQPHGPYANDRELDEYSDDSELRDNYYDLIRRGKVSKKRVWNSYKENLHYVLNDIELLLENLEADRVAITADHGNGFGEKGVYSHPYNVPTRELRVVPWIITSGNDSESHVPELEPSTDQTTSSEKLLKGLGYLE